MKSHTAKLQLIWNVNKFRARFNGVDIAIAPQQFPPFQVDALVEEQDTAMLLGESHSLPSGENKPVWYFANKLESKNLPTPGQVVVRDTQPLRLQAIVHDLDAEPSCSELWIFQAIQQIFDTAESRDLQAIQMPLLGTRYSQITSTQFFTILLEIIVRKRPAPIGKIWLVSTDFECEKLFRELTRQVKQKI